jgi:hypothetical protein
MKNGLRFVAFTLWIAGATLLLAWLCLNHPAFTLPISESMWVWIFSHVPGFWDGEAGDDLVLLVHLAVSLAIVLCMTWLFRHLLRRRRAKS